MCTPRPVLALLALGLWAGCGGRHHPPEPGAYRVELLEALEDGCGLWGGGSMGATLSSTGNSIWLELELFELSLAGSYLPKSDRFVVSGTASDVPLSVGGEACVTPWLGMDLAAEATGEESFEGVLSLQVGTTPGTACSCFSELRVRGVRQ